MKSRLVPDGRKAWTTIGAMKQYSKAAHTFLQNKQDYYFLPIKCGGEKPESIWLV
jgi:hypothetical protein